MMPQGRSYILRKIDQLDARIHALRMERGELEASLAAFDDMNPIWGSEYATRDFKPVYTSMRGNVARTESQRQIARGVDIGEQRGRSILTEFKRVALERPDRKPEAPPNLDHYGRTRLDMVLSVLHEHGGMEAYQIMIAIYEKYKVEIPKTSLSSQLCRWRKEGFVRRDGTLWHFVKKRDASFSSVA